jgi:hypothetical protein
VTGGNDSDKSVLAVKVETSGPPVEHWGSTMVEHIDVFTHTNDSVALNLIVLGFGNCVWRV